MSRIDRLKEYEKPLRNWQGETNDKANIDRWSRRATSESRIAPHATGLDETAEAHSTGKRTDLRDTAMSPRTARNADARMVAKDDKNFVGDSSYMAGVRRNA
jgi:hypothetical protein